MSDISDGIEKKIVAFKSFFKAVTNEWENQYGEERFPIDQHDDIDSFSLAFSVPMSRKIIDESAINFIDNYEHFSEGKIDQLTPKTGVSRVLSIMKKISNNTLYASIEAESIELTGYAVISGILNVYQRLLKLNDDEFQSLCKHESKDLEYERRLFNRIGPRYIRAYEYMIADLPNDIEDKKLGEWWARIHLIIDHISGMTDEFALDTYQMIKGIKLLPV